MGNIVAQITVVSDLVKTILPVLGLLAVFLAGGLYSFGMMSGSEDLRAKMKGWAQRVGVGGGVAVVVGVAAPAILTWLQGF